MVTASRGPRLAMSAVHLLGLTVSTWLLLGSGPPSARHIVLAACAWVYFARFLVTTFHLLARQVPWSEAIVVGVWLFVLQVMLAFLGSRSTAPLGLLDAFAVALYVLGSFLNTGSELQRKAWKAAPENRGHLYTQGLFGLSMHVNYFGDVLLFTGFAVLTSSPWALLLSVVMAAGFVFGHIPRLDAHLGARYGEEFREWERRTKRFVPFVY
jgi:protein-S-isoprenylcysteine O-methyltransferase Ste14